MVTSLAETPAQLAAAVRDLTASELAWVPRMGEWAIVEHLWHVRDLEVEGFSVRIRKILTGTNPKLPDIDGEKLAIARAYIRKDAHTALAEFSAERTRTVTMARSLSANELARCGHLEGVGSISLGGLLERMLEHDRGHLETVTQIAALIRNDRTGASR